MEGEALDYRKFKYWIELYSSTKGKEVTFPPNATTLCLRDRCQIAIPENQTISTGLPRPGFLEFVGVEQRASIVLPHT